MNAQVRIREDGLHFQAVTVGAPDEIERDYGLAFTAPFTLSGEARGYLKGVMATATLPSLAGTGALYVPTTLEAEDGGLRIRIGEANFLWKTAPAYVVKAVLDEQQVCCEDEDECCQESEATDYEVTLP